jgi:hypothetical protein
MGLYIAKKGDTYESIAKYFEINVKTLRALNGAPDSIAAQPTPLTYVRIPNKKYPPYKPNKWDKSTNGAGKAAKRLVLEFKDLAKKPQPYVLPVYNEQNVAVWGEAVRNRGEQEPRSSVIMDVVYLNQCAPVPERLRFRQTANKPAYVDPRVAARARLSDQRMDRITSPHPQASVSQTIHDGTVFAAENPELIPEVGVAAKAGKVALGFGMEGLKSISSQYKEKGEVDWTDVGAESSKGGLEKIFRFGPVGEILIATGTDTAKKVVNNAQDGKALGDGITASDTVMSVGKSAADKGIKKGAQKLQDKVTKAMQPQWTKVLKSDGAPLGVKIPNIHHVEQTAGLSQKAAEKMTDKVFDGSRKAFLDKAEEVINKCFNKDTLMCEPDAKSNVK